MIRLDSKDLAAQEAQASVDGAQSTYTTVKNTNDRNQELYKAGALSKAQMEESLAALNAAQSELSSSQISK